MVSALNIFNSEQDVASQVVAFIVAVAAEAIHEKGTFTIGLSGGSAAKYFCENIFHYETDWSKWHVIFCDERYVDSSDPESIYGFYLKHFFNKVSIPANQVLKVNTIIGDVSDAAAEYEESMRRLFGNSKEFPQIDLLLLGIGPDGHTCSLFPNHMLLEENTRWVASLTDSPKPPPSRSTLTLPVLNNARNVVFAACGQSKSGVLKRIFEEKSKEIPASLVQPKDGKVYWFVDKEASKDINRGGEL